MSLVYFMQAGDIGPIKIGFTKSDPRRRLVKLQSDCHEDVRLLGAVYGTLQRERQFHQELSDYKTRGEWFAPHPNVVAAIKSALDAGPTFVIPDAVSTAKGHAKYDHPLCLWRAENMKTLRDLGSAAGISIITLSQIESGKKKPGLNIIADLCRATGLPASVLRPDWHSMFAEFG
jgi:DNA-binding XRE family transcriptional regulator